MEPSTASRTALATSLMRAIHARIDPKPIFIDPWGDRLVPDEARERIRQRALAAGVSGGKAGATVDRYLRASAAYATVITRSRYAEDALHAALVTGVRQYVLIGAGFDSYALRTSVQAHSLAIYEVDHPATQSLKKAQIFECGIALRDAVHFLPADLSIESLDEVLLRSQFSRGEPSFVSWLGVTMYLTREENLSSLRAIARCTGEGSEIVFTYLDQSFFSEVSQSTVGSLSDLQKTVTSLGEPFLSGFDHNTLSNVLESVGFELVEDLSDADLVAYYDPANENGFRPASQSRIARARVLRRDLHMSAA